MKGEYHITYFPPSSLNDNWPRGGFSVYQITGDQIADRIRFDDSGKVVRRDSWCGFLGIRETLDEVKDLIQQDMTS